MGSEFHQIAAFADKTQVSIQEKKLLPKNLFTYWHQGFDSAPLVPQNCFAQIKAVHCHDTVRALDSSALQEIRPYIPLSDEAWMTLPLVKKTVLGRTALLIKHGGVWMDSTVFPKVDIFDWLQDKMDAGIFFFQRPGPGRLIANWFIAAQPEHPILIALMAKLCNYYETQNWAAQTRPNTISFKISAKLINRHPSLTRVWFWPTMRKLVPQSPYHIYHFALYDLLCTNPELLRLWNDMPVVSAVPPHGLQLIGLQRQMTEKAAKLIADVDVPLFKLTWKLPEPQMPEGSVLSYLFKDTRA